MNEQSRKRVCLLTGGPGTGKTTIIRQAVGGWHGRAGGFYTEELRDRGQRQGFRLVTLAGQSGVLAHVDIRSPCRVGKYGVDVAALDAIGVASLEEATSRSDLIVIDEIGKMELFSSRFRDAVFAAIDSDKRVLGTVMSAPHPWADKVKTRPEVWLVEVTRANRDRVLSEVIRWLELNATGDQ
ncbi:MAG: NTPase [Chloroflexota bacterium]